MNDLFKDFWVFDLSGEAIMSIIIMLIVCLFVLIVHFFIRKIDPLKKPRGIMVALEWMVQYADDFTYDILGKNYKDFGGYALSLAVFILLSFILGASGLPNPMTYLGTTLGLAIITFLMIHFTAIKYKGLRYFKRYTEPFFPFLPVNLISMWAPILSLSFRLFGNAIAGWVLMSIVYWALGGLSGLIFSFIPGTAGELIIAPIITPFLHVYFDLFSGGIQTLVFVMLTTLFIAQEIPEEEEILPSRTVKRENI